jgi:SAM-dependent methyltransferase
MIKKSLGDLHPERIVDLGCGTGVALSWLEGYKVGIDFSQELIKNAHRGADYIIADVETTPFRDGSFDLALCLDVAEHLPSLKVIDEGQRILVDKGILHLSTADQKYEFLLELLERLNLKLPEGPHTWRRPQEIRQKMIQAGFSCDEWSRIPIRFYRGIKQPSTMVTS